MSTGVSLSHFGVDALGWVGLAITAGTFTLALYAYRCCGRSLNPDRPLYLLLAAAAVPGVAWFVSVVFDFTTPTTAWRAWSRVVLLTPYLAIGIVIVIRMLRGHVPWRRH